MKGPYSAGDQERRNRCQRCGQPAAKGNDWCGPCEDENAAEAREVLRQAADEHLGGAR